MRLLGLFAFVTVLACCSRGESRQPLPTPSPRLESLEPDRRALEAAQAELTSEDWQTRRRAIEELASLDDGAAGRLRLLTAALTEDPNDSVRLAAARVLGELGDQRAVAALTRALEDDSDLVRSEAARALGRLGPRATSAIPALMKGLRAENMDSFPRFMGSSAKALASIGREALPALAAAASDRTAYALVEQALADMGPSVLPVLEEMLAAGGDSAKTASIAMRLMGPSASPAVPALVEASRGGRIDTESFVYDVYILGSAAKPAIPRLLELLEDPGEASQRCSIATALKRTGARAPAVTEALRAAAGDEENSTTHRCLEEAAEALGPS